MEEVVLNNSQVLLPISLRPVIDTILTESATPKAQCQPCSGVFAAEVNYSFSPSTTCLIDGIITFFEAPLRKLFMPHDDALILTLEVGKHLMKRILVDPSSVADLLYLPTLLCLGYKPNNLREPRRVLIGFNGSQTNSIGEIVFPVLIGPITALVPFTMIDEPSSFNTILWRT